MQIANLPVQGAMVNTRPSQKQSADLEGSNPFQDLLNLNKAMGEVKDLLSNHPASEEVSLLDQIKGLLEQGGSLGELMDMLEIKDLSDLLALLPNIDLDIDEAEITDEQLGELLLRTIQDMEDSDQEQIITQAVDFVEDIGKSVSELKNDLVQLLSTISDWIDRVKQGDTLNKQDLSKLKSLLEKWSMLKSQTANTDIQVSKLSSQVLEEDNDLWEMLVQRFEKRSYYANKNIYGQDSTISKGEINAWLTHALNQYTDITEKSAATQQNAPISRMEQYVLHVEHTGRIERVGADMVNKFVDTIKQSQFLSRPNGSMELNFTLRPENMGNITVRMVQVNGEMMVKLLVSSQMTKDMLENNIHQLRHLFSPHQVSIERNEMVTDKEFYFNDQEDGQNDAKQDDGNHEDQPEGHDKQSEVDFSTIFNQISEEVENVKYN